ncbi:demethylase [Campylobacter sp. CCUG 57310]|uniref:demethylase n=1 Tax=Campylobacter sp. CCUG 57310 TaxID=2517362 RepID=UPI001564CD2F|nr:demethylase [Campylobacter sp. CCUG 57310]QKF93188.1 hypothetical protein CORI_a002 [Campylobacter sp. CCUG 57310]
MQTFTNSKGFKIIKTSRLEITAIGGFGICDSCSKTSSAGYLIPALGSYWYCEECYQEWLKTCKYYEEDREFETNKYLYFLKLLDIQMRFAKDFTK